jgi:hypothetical protein
LVAKPELKEEVVMANKEQKRSGREAKKPKQKKKESPKPAANKAQPPRS